MSKVFKQLSYLALVFFLGACRFNAQEMSEKSLAFLMKEKEIFEQLKQESTKQALGLSSSSTGRFDLIQNGSKLLFNEYLPLIHLIEKDLLRESSKYDDRAIKDLLADLDPQELRDLREKTFPEHKKLLNSFLSRKQTLTLALTTWEMRDLEKQIRNLKLIKLDNGTLHFSIPEESLSSFLSFVYLPDQNPSIHFDFKIKLEEAPEFYDTRKKCLELVELLQDNDCKEEARALCGHQMNLNEVGAVVANFEKSFCRDRKTSFFVDSYGALVITSKFTKNTVSYDLVKAMKDAISKEAVTIDN